MGRVWNGWHRRPFPMASRTLSMSGKGRCVDLVVACGFYRPHKETQTRAWGYNLHCVLFSFEMEKRVHPRAPGP